MTKNQKYFELNHCNIKIANFLLVFNIPKAHRYTSCKTNSTQQFLQQTENCKLQNSRLFLEPITLQIHN